ncbi:PHP family Zn ribbon phosphoesterase [Azospirillum fermentarium]|nr:PHP family Zn ribbon phosphoesterase [Azospirillum fermentarium]
MIFHADLHVHSRLSRATSRDLDLEHLAWWAARKGIRVVATGDCVHPAWQAEIRDTLVAEGNGLYRLKPDLERRVWETLPETCRRPVSFMLSTEISTIYKKGDKTRKIHHLVYAADLDAAVRLSASLARIGNIASDGRPILGLDSRDLLEITLESGPDSYLVPAHIWTPWFAVLGSQSGFDSVAECYGDLAGHIFAVETGLSSDPAMNWRVSSLDRYRLVSNSDAHSPAKLGRETTRFLGDPGYAAMRRALESGEGYGGTVEFFPEEGKYHMDGHRTCGVRLDPKETLALGGLCPVCGTRVTVGVAHRVEMLADRDVPVPPPTAGPVTSLVPLPEILSEIVGTGVASKAVAEAYNRVTQTHRRHGHGRGDRGPHRPGPRRAGPGMSGFRRSGGAGGGPARHPPRRRRRVAGPFLPHPGRRVSGRGRAAIPPAAPAGGGWGEPVRDRRPASGHLWLPRRRRGVLPALRRRLPGGPDVVPVTQLPLVGDDRNGGCRGDRRRRRRHHAGDGGAGDGPRRRRRGGGGGLRRRRHRRPAGRA